MGQSQTRAEGLTEGCFVFHFFGFWYFFFPDFYLISLSRDDPSYSRFAFAQRGWQVFKMRARFLVRNNYKSEAQNRNVLVRGQ